MRWAPWPGAGRGDRCWRPAPRPSRGCGSCRSSAGRGRRRSCARTITIPAPPKHAGRPGGDAGDPPRGGDAPAGRRAPRGRLAAMTARRRPTSTSSPAWRVPLRRPDADEPARLAELLAAVAATAEAGDFGTGRAVAAFEGELAAALGAANAVGVGSGTAAIRLALGALGIGRGDVVVVPAATHVGVAEAVVHLGAGVRLADVDEDTGLLTAATLARVIDARVRAVVVVPLAGATADVEAIGEVARAVGARVVEDASHAPGAVLGARRA